MSGKKACFEIIEFWSVLNKRPIRLGKALFADMTETARYKCPSYAFFKNLADAEFNYERKSFSGTTTENIDSVHYIRIAEALLIF